MRGFLLFLTACGRIGFDSASPPPGDDAASPDGAAPGTIALHVSTAGAPVAAGYVLLDDDTILRTDESGRAVIPATVPRTFHVVHQQAAGFALGLWRVVSLYDVEPESSIELGRPADGNPVAALDLTALADGAADTYRLYGPTRCGRELIASNQTTFTVSYPPTCEGTTAELFLLSEVAGVVQNAAQSPSFTYGDGADVAFGAWAPAPTSTIRFSNLALGTTELSAQIFHAAANGDMYIVATKQGGVSGEELVFDAVAPRAANHVAFIVAEQASAHGAVTPLAASGVVDVAALPPLISPLGLDPVAQTLSWDDVSGSKLVFAQTTISATEAMIEWTAYAPPTSRSVTFPALPPELAAIAPGATATFESSSMVAVFSDQITSQRFRELLDTQFIGWFVGIGSPPSPIELVAATVAMP